MAFRPHLRLFQLGLGIALVVFGVSCGGDGGSPAPSPDSLAIATPIPDSAVVGTTHSTVVSVLDDNGDPIQGTIVRFAVTAGGGSLSADSVASDGAGHAATEWTLGTGVTVNALSISVTGIPNRVVQVYSQPGPLDTLIKVAGDSQIAYPDSLVAVVPRVRALDAYGNPVNPTDYSLTWEITAGGGQVLGWSQFNDTLGYNSPTSWRLGPDPLTTNTLRVYRGGVSATFTATTNAGLPPKYALVATVNGRVRDFDGQRVLFLAADSTHYVIRTLASGLEDTLSLPAGYTTAGFVSASPTAVALTPLGALILAYDPASPNGTKTLLEWRNGSLTTTTGLQSFSFAIDGSWTVYLTTGSSDLDIHRRDLNTGTDLIIAPSVDGDRGFDVAPNGDVVYTVLQYAGGNPFSEVVRYHGGTTDTLTALADSAFHTQPVADNSGVAYAERLRSVSGPWSTKLRVDTTTVTLATGFANEPSSSWDFLTSAGWTGFTAPSGGTTAVWTRSPAGTLTQMASKTGQTRLVALGTDGSLIFGNPASGTHWWYVAAGGGAPVDLGPAKYQARWLGDHFGAFAGNQVFTVTP